MSDEWWLEPLTFAEREVHRYAECVQPADLKVGHVYFRLSFLDREMTLPELTALVFVGRDLNRASDGSHQLYFQDARSYFAGVRWEDPTPPITGEMEEERFESWLARGHFELSDESESTGVLEFENALNLLLFCSLQRRGLDRHAPPNSA